MSAYVKYYETLMIGAPTKNDARGHVHRWAEAWFVRHWEPPAEPEGGFVRVWNCQDCRLTLVPKERAADPPGRLDEGAAPLK